MMTPAQTDTALRAAATAEVERRRTEEVLLVVEALAAGLFVLREAQRDAADARDAHLQALGVEVPEDNRGLAPFANYSGSPPLVRQILNALGVAHRLYQLRPQLTPVEARWNPRRIGPCDASPSPLWRGDAPTLLYLQSADVDALPSPDRWVLVEGEDRLLWFEGSESYDRPLPDSIKVERTIPLALFHRVVAAAREVVGS
jgi:hypothetical protein